MYEMVTITIRPVWIFLLIWIGVNYLITALFFAMVRHLLDKGEKRKAVKRMTDFGTQKIFEGESAFIVLGFKIIMFFVIAPSAIILLSTKQVVEEYLMEFIEKDEFFDMKEYHQKKKVKQIDKELKGETPEEKEVEKSSSESETKKQVTEKEKEEVPEEEIVDEMEEDEFNNMEEFGKYDALKTQETDKEE